MVFFTCNNCGDSLKKKDCANHAGKCRPLALTCVDCHKDFFGDEFVAHTSCVTEAEKYGVKGFVSRSPSTAGVAKQEEWTRAVLSASEASGLTSSQKYFLGILTRHGNVPRKKKPFQNFARNVWRDSVRNINVVDQVFDLLEAELKKMKGPPKETDTSKAKAEIIGEIDDKAVNAVAELEVDATTDKKPKRKKEKALDELIAIANGGKEKIDINVITDQAKKSKKKNKAASCDGVEKNETEVAPANSENEIVSKKSKKKKHKKQDTETEKDVTQNGNGTIEESISVEDDPTNTENKKKKRRRKEAQVAEEATKNGDDLGNESVNAEDDPTNTEKKKKKRRRKEAQVEEEATRNCNGVENESVTAEDDASSTGKKKKKKNKLDETNQNGSVELVEEDLQKKAKKKKCKKLEENGTEALESQNILGESQFDAAKDTIKKSKKKKHKLQEAEELPRKKSKSTSG